MQQVQVGRMPVTRRSMLHHANPCTFLASATSPIAFATTGRLTMAGYLSCTPSYLPTCLSRPSPTCEQDPEDLIHISIRCGLDLRWIEAGNPRCKSRAWFHPRCQLDSDPATCRRLTRDWEGQPLLAKVPVGRIMVITLGSLPCRIARSVCHDGRGLERISQRLPSMNTAETPACLPEGNARVRVSNSWQSTIQSHLQVVLSLIFLSSSNAPVRSTSGIVGADWMRDSDYVGCIKLSRLPGLLRSTVSCRDAT